MSSRPPVTSQDDWAGVLLPWIERVERELAIEDAGCDVDRLHETAGVVAHEVQRSMAPISAYLVGVAVGRGMSLERACALVEDVTAARHPVA